MCPALSPNTNVLAASPESAVYRDDQKKRKSGVKVGTLYNCCTEKKKLVHGERGRSLYRAIVEVGVFQVTVVRVVVANVVATTVEEFQPRRASGTRRQPRPAYHTLVAVIAMPCVHVCK